MLLEDVENGESSWLIVERLADASTQTYAQCLRLVDGRYVVEHRDGSPTRHFTAVVDDFRAAHSVLTAWAFGLPGWRENPWAPLTL